MILSAPEPLGELALFEVYFEHDGPRLYSVSRPRDESHFMALCVEEDDDELKYVYWSVTIDDLGQVERGETALLDSLRQSDQVFVVVEDYTQEPVSVTVMNQSADSLPYRYLPIEDAKLTELDRAKRGRTSSISTTAIAEVPQSMSPTPIRENGSGGRFLDAFSLNDLNEAALTDRHLYTAVEVASDGGAVNLSGLAQIADSVQEVIYAIGNEDQGLVRTGETVRSALDLSVYGARAASFVLILRTPDQGALFEGPLGERALRGLTWILKSAQSEADIVTELEKRTLQVRRRVRDLLTVISETDSGLTALVTNGTEVTWGRVTQTQAINSLGAITNVPPTVRTLYLENVLLTALNLTRLTFEVWDRASGRKYSGSLSQQVLSEVDGLAVSQSGRLYAAQVEVETDFAQARLGPARRNRLLSISPT